jgi:hypothetical protein
VKRTLAQLFVLSTFFAVNTAMADDFALGAKAGFLGLGVEGTMRLADHFNLRAGINKYSRSVNETESDVDYHANVDLQSVALLFDFHPFAGTFRLSAGLMSNGNKFHLDATPTSNVNIGGTTHTPAEVGTLTGDIKFKSGAPYLGIGWGNAVGHGSPFTFIAEIGAMFQGKANVSLNSTGGTQSNNATFQSQLRQEEQDVSNDIGKIYPVVSFGFAYRF